ncbi:pyrroline-5-carboxylate reductase [Pseudomonas lini]
MNVLFLGYGKMGSALGEAWLASGLVQQVVALDPGQPHGVNAQVFTTVAALPTQAFDLVVIAVKPAMAASALATLPAQALEGAMLLSVMAGVTCASLNSAVGGKPPVVRAMPNTPVLVNAGCTGLYTDAQLTDLQRQRLSELFGAVGVAFWVDQESLLHSVTALSGSGPAYYHLFSEALAAAGVELGLPKALAEQLAAHTALGAAKLQCQPLADFVALREAVTSPNGTTAAAIGVFEADAGLRRLVSASTHAAHQRSVELSAD